MNNYNKSHELDGLATISRAVTSPLRMGEIATHRPFSAFEGVNINSLRAIPVSQQKMDGVLNRQSISNQKFYKCVKTLVKKIDNNTIEFQHDYRWVQFVLGKQPIKKDGKLVSPPLTFEECVKCSLANHAYDCFKTLDGVSFNIQLNGRTIQF